MDRSVFVPLLLSGLFWSSSALSRQYHYIKTRMSWSEAQSYCRAGFTDLATVDTMDDVKRLINTVDVGYSGSVWIGLKRGTQKRWGWSDGDDIAGKYTFWSDGEQDTELYDCGVYIVFWSSNPCSDLLPFVCYNASTGYITINSLVNWTDAQSFCRQHHNDMASIRSTKNSQMLMNNVPNDKPVWIGLFRDSWEWSDNSSRLFRYWAAGQPSGSDDCAGMSTTDSGKWAQYSCDLLLPFICYGDDKRNGKQILRLKLSCNGKCTLNDPSQQTAILNKISAKLKSLGLKSDFKLSWRKSEGEEVFHEEIDYTACSNNECNRP